MRKGGIPVQIVIDRLEGDFAVAELPGGKTCAVPRALFPGAAEGDVFVISKEAREREARESRIQNQFDRLKRKETD